MTDVDDLPPAGPATVTAATVPAAGDAWRTLSPRARGVFAAGGAFGWLLMALAAQVPIALLLPWDALKVPLAIAVLLALPAIGGWLGARRWRFTGWRLDAEGFAVRRGRVWQVDTRVPATRVQHVDLKRGPLERRFGLSTLVVHTAGTRNSAVALPGLDATDAMHLRDTLARQVDDDDDDA